MTLLSARSTQALPAQPLIASVVLKCLAGGGDRDLAPFIEVDPSLTVALLQAANAPHLRQARRVATVRQAMVILGTAAAGAIATSRTAALVLDADDVGCPKNYWVRSIAAAAGSSVIANRLGCNADEAFTAGMIHDLGDLMMFRSDPELHGVITARVAKGGRTLLEQEKVLFGRTHTDVGADRLEQSLFPDRLVRAVRMHHGVPDSASESLTRAVWAGVRIGLSVAGVSVPNTPEEIVRPDAVLKAIGLVAEDPKRVLADTEAQVQRILGVVAGGQ